MSAYDNRRWKQLPIWLEKLAGKIRSMRKLGKQEPRKYVR